MKLLLFFFAIVFAFSTNAQVALTFEVDMTNEVVSPNGVHVAGAFLDPDLNGTFDNPGLTQWLPDQHLLTDEDGDGVYSITLMVAPFRYEYKFFNGNATVDSEVVPQACTVELNGNSNREVWVESEPVTVSVCYARCVACNHKSARIRIDMSNYDFDLDGLFAEPGDDINPSGIYLAGDFQNPTGVIGDWDPSATKLRDDDGNNIYEANVDVGNMSLIYYSAINGNEWTNDVDNAPSPCGDGSGNRFGAIIDQDEVFQVECWGSCYACEQVSEVTFQVNMNNYCGDLAQGVFLLGEFSNWVVGYTMTDLDTDGIYSTTFSIMPGSYVFRFRVGESDWESIDRTITVEGTDQVLPLVCFNSLTDCPAYVEPADVTFEVQVEAGQVPDGQSVWLMTDATSTAWEYGALLMTDEDQNHVWSVTMEDLCAVYFEYKFVIGLPYQGELGTEWSDESYDFLNSGCGVINNDEGYVRTYTRLSAEPLTLCHQYNSCNNCGTSPGCMIPEACNYNPSATVEDNSCFFVATPCDDGNQFTTNDLINESCNCAGLPLDVNCGGDIFISEYVEGFGNNKAIELFNPTNSPIVLDGVYSFGRYRDGALEPMLMPIGGIIEPYATRVFALDKRDPMGTGTELPILPELEAVADTFVNPILILENSPFYFNGDDGFVLMRDGNVMIDLIGVIGVDPGEGWYPPADPAMVAWTANHTMVRKASVYQGITSNPADMQFDPSVEWDTLSMNDFSHLGFHNFICPGLELGCSDLDACNYTPNVVNDPSMCIYPGCDDSAACNYDPSVCGGGECIYPGCDDPAACNYIPDVCGDDSCIYPGCADPEACNYEPGVCGDDSCIYPGCLDALACNYDPAACEGGVCIYPGCTDPEACNYDEQACEGGSCYYPEIEGDTDCSGSVLLEDLMDLLNAFGCVDGCELYDINNDGVVGVDDIVIMIGMFGL